LHHVLLIGFSVRGVSGVAWICGKEIGDYLAVLLVLAETAHFATTVGHKFNAALAPRIELSLSLGLIK
jgi:hypothetical protein